MFENKTAKELKDYARKNKITGYSRLKKSELIILLKQSQKKKVSKHKPISQSFMQPQITSIKSSKQLLSEIKRKIESKDLIIELSKSEYTDKIWHLSDKRRIISIFVKKESSNETIVKSTKDNKLIRNPKWVVLCVGDYRPDDLYVFGKKDECSYKKVLVDKALKVLKNPKIYYKEGSILKLENDNITFLIASRVPVKDIPYSRDNTFILYSDYIKLRKIPMQKLKQGIPYHVGGNKDNVIREYYISRKILDAKPLNVKKVADLIDFYKHNPSDKYYVNSKRTTMFSKINLLMYSMTMKEELKSKKRVYLNKENVRKGAKTSDFIKLNVKLEKETREEGFKPIYIRKYVIMAMTIFKNPKFYVSKGGLLFAIENGITLVTTPGVK